MLTDWISWRWGLFINVPIGLALVVLAPPLPARDRTTVWRFDLTGAATSTLGMTTLVYGFVRAASMAGSRSRRLVAQSVEGHIQNALDLLRGGGRNDRDGTDHPRDVREGGVRARGTFLLCALQQRLAHRRDGRPAALKDLGVLTDACDQFFGGRVTSARDRERGLDLRADMC